MIFFVVVVNDVMECCGITEQVMNTHVLLSLRQSFYLYDIPVASAVDHGDVLSIRQLTPLTDRHSLIVSITFFII